MRHKYVRHNQFGFVLFLADTEVSHVKMARMLNTIASTGSVISAGFVWISQDGSLEIEKKKSESLNLGPAPDDERALKNQIGF